MRTVIVEITEEQASSLRRLARAWGVGGQTAEDTLRHLVQHVCDGVRRPGSWERQVVLQLCGEVPGETAPSPEDDIERARRGY